MVLGTVGPGEIRKYNREQLGALVYGAMSELRVPANRADRAAPTREKNVIAR